MWELRGDMLEDFIIIWQASIIPAFMEKSQDLFQVYTQFQGKRRCTENAWLAIITPAVSRSPHFVVNLPAAETYPLSRDGC